jgi:predicted ATPase
LKRNPRNMEVFRTLASVTVDERANFFEDDMIFFFALNHKKKKRKQQPTRDIINMSTTQPSDLLYFLGKAVAVGVAAGVTIKAMDSLFFHGTSSSSSSSRSAAASGEAGSGGQPSKHRRLLSFRAAAEAIIHMQRRFNDLEGVHPDQAIANAKGRGDTAVSSTTFRVVMTGGPCGGKSTSLKLLTEALTARGFGVYTTPEVPTILINGGCAYPGPEGPATEVFESQLISLQMQLENTFTSIAAHSGKPSVIIFDRGINDAAAYLDPKVWDKILKLNHWDAATIDKRYDAVLHLVTAADGAEAFYTHANNAARRESPEEAREVDAKLRKAWSEHPHVKVIGNTEGGFDQKMKNSIDAIVELLDKHPAGLMATNSQKKN